MSDIKFGFSTTSAGNIDFTKPITVADGGTTYTSNIHVQNGVAIKNIIDIGIYRDASITSTDIVYIDNFVAGRSWDEVRQ